MFAFDRFCQRPQLGLSLNGDKVFRLIGQNVPEALVFLPFEIIQFFISQVRVTAKKKKVTFSPLILFIYSCIYRFI